MPTVIDSLIVEIGLDPDKFTKGQKAALKSFHDAAEEARKTAGTIETSSKRSAEFLGLLNTRLMAVGELLVSSKLVGQVLNFTAAITKQDAASSRLAYTLGTNVNTLDKWRNAAFLTGGSSEGITASIQGLTNQFQDFAITGESSVIPWFRALNVQIADAEGKMRPFDEIMHDLANAFQKLSPEKAAAFGRNMGLDQSAVNLLVKGGDELDRILKLSNSNLTSEGAENARKLAEAWALWETSITKVGRALRDFFAPGTVGLLESQSNTFNELSKGQWISPGSLLDSIIHGTKFRGFGVAGGSAGASAGSGAFGSDAEKEAFIRAEAAKRGISPDVAMGVARSEGFKSYSGDLDATGKPTSFGAFQLHYPGLGRNTAEGLGTTFTNKTGLDARDPATERQQIQFALDQAKEGGWGPWHGWKGSQWAGIDKGSSSKTETKIGTINIQTQATDSPGIAASIGPAIQRNGLATQSQSGPQ